MNGRYSEPENLGDSINTLLPERDVFVSADGGLLLWARPGGPPLVGDDDLYVSPSRAGVWMAGDPLGAPANSEFNDNAPPLLRDGAHLFFASNRGSFATPAEARLPVRDFMERMERVETHRGNVFRVPVAEALAPLP